MKWIPCACVSCTEILDKLWYTGVSHNEQTRYHPVLDCTYWPVLGYFNNWNIVKSTNKSTPSEDFDDIHKIFLDGTSDDMASPVQTGKYGAINTTDTKKIGYYVVKYVSGAFI